MTEHYVTLFDGSFLPQGLALHTSLERHAGDYALWVIAVDDLAHDTLRALDLRNVHVVDLREIESDELLSVKDGRSRGEYCWTLTPFTPAYVLRTEPSAHRATYVDADMWLARSPAPVFAELEASGKAVLITDHAYSPEYDQAASSGRFCVQFMPFVRDGGDEVARWWQEKCIEWCYARIEPTRFGDQKYLDDWPARFADSVHVLDAVETLQAPWNATRFDPHDAIAYHFHELRTMRAGRVRLGHYRLPEPTIDLLYQPYLVDLAAALDALAQVGVRPPDQKPYRGIWTELKDWLALRGLDRTPPRSPLTASLRRS